MTEEVLAAVATISFLALLVLALKWRCRDGLNRHRSNKARGALTVRG